MSEGPDTPPVRLHGIGTDPRTGAWFRVYGVRDPDGRASRVVVPFAAGQQELLGRLAAAGYPVPLLPGERLALLQRLQAQERSPGPKRAVAGSRW